LLDPDEPGLVSLTDIGALLYLNHLDLFEHLEAMASLDQQDHIASAENPAFEIVLFGVVEVNPEPSFPYEQYFLGKLNLPRHGVMDVGLNDLPKWMSHERQLLRKFIGSKKPDAWLPKFCPYDGRAQHTTCQDVLNIIRPLADLSFSALMLVHVSLLPAHPLASGSGA